MGLERESEKRLIPITTDLMAAPDDLLRIIRCNCQTDCGTMRCTCRKHAIRCSIVCGNCKGSGCMNSPPNEDDSGNCKGSGCMNSPPNEDDSDDDSTDDVVE